VTKTAVTWEMCQDGPRLQLGTWRSGIGRGARLSLDLKNSVGRPQPPHALEPFGRIGALDGLRGVAALVVLAQHTLAIDPAFYAASLGIRSRDLGDRSWWLIYTPLHLFWQGTEAVFVFFVLSGFVLALPAAEKGGIAWRAYYPKRLIRLYLPVWGAVALAAAWIAVVRRHVIPGASGWLNLHRPPGIAGFLHDVALVAGTPGISNRALWSLKWEVIFSVLLPVFLIFALVLPRLLAIKIAGIAIAIVGGAALGRSPLFYLPMFAAGTLIAFERHRLRRIAKMIDRSQRSRLAWCLLAVAALLLLNSYWLVYAAPVASSPALNHIGDLTRGLQVAGACLAIFLLIGWTSAQRQFERSVPKWLGSRSFSLYLVHEPVVVSVALLLGGRPNLVLFAILVVPASLGIAEIFYRLIESRSHRLARHVGRATLVSAAPSGAPSPKASTRQ
jgi:peptidoglycan/LPS O-acetylase OafA/YrhL